MKKTAFLCLVLCFCLVLGMSAQAVDTRITAEEFLTRLRTACELYPLELEENAPTASEKYYSQVLDIGGTIVVFTADNETDKVISLGYPVGDSDTIPSLLACIASFLLTPEEMMETPPVAYAADRMVVAQTELDKMMDEFEANGTIAYSDGDLVYRYNRNPENGQLTFVVNPCDE